MNISFKNIFRVTAPLTIGLSVNFIYGLISKNVKLIPDYKYNICTKYNLFINPGLFIGIVIGSSYTFFGDTMITLLHKRIKY